MSTASNRDLSKLSALLATHTASPAAVKPKPARIPSAANDNAPAPSQLAWPAFERLAHRRDEARLYALRHWKNLLFPGSEIESPPQTAEAAVETRTEERPSEGELMVAIGWEITGRERWAGTGEMVNTYEAKPCAENSHVNRNGGTDTSIGKLLFRDGRLIQWGETRKGRPLKPVERPRSPKGGDDPSRSESAIWSYLALKGAVSPLAAVPYQKPFSKVVVIDDCYKPLPREAPTEKDKAGRFGVAEARAVLEEFSVSGITPFDKLPFPAVLLPDGIVTGDQWVGGVKKPKPLGEISSSAGREPEIVRHGEIASHLTALRRMLGKHALVLDMAISDATAKEIGMAMGLGPAYAEKRGPALIDAAIDALIAFDETAIDDPAEIKMAA
ncbi:hypothetical protein [Rhizobium tumorigenes]|uniref:hypothetical protein n=1 Tax=Rhizobium tumorigenes TaxID=2041385 RepID=UPI00241FE23A|nr:hypothetical protein [Rhizobium tumorigenes]WFS02789.1 hypothetical protein PR016_09380 [Rhizobium tumorigenes]